MTAARRGRPVGCSARRRAPIADCWRCCANSARSYAAANGHRAASHRLRTAALPGIAWRMRADPGVAEPGRAFAERACCRRAARTRRDPARPRLPAAAEGADAGLPAGARRARADGLTRWPRWLAARTLRRACRGRRDRGDPSAWTRGSCGDRRRARSASCSRRRTASICRPPATARRPRPRQRTASCCTSATSKRARTSASSSRPWRSCPPQRPELWLVGADAGALSGLQRHARSARRSRAPSRPRRRRRTRRRSTRTPALVVLPSRHEGFGLPALEALAHGAPAAGRQLRRAAGSGRRRRAPRCWCGHPTTPPRGPFEGRAAATPAQIHPIGAGRRNHADRWPAPAAPRAPARTQLTPDPDPTSCPSTSPSLVRLRTLSGQPPGRLLGAHRAPRLFDGEAGTQQP
jgi:hypothetical protein